MKYLIGKNTPYLFISFMLMMVFFSCSLGAKEIPEKPMVIVVASYKNINWYERNLSSILSQNYDNYRVIYVDDFSPDGTADAVEKFVQESGKESQFTLIRNKVRIGAMANLYKAIHSCNNDEIIVTVDGDDWLYHPEVLKQLNEVYSSREVWFTHGTLIEHPWGNVTWCEPIPDEIVARNAFRDFKCPSHLRTFYAWIFKKIPLEDFMYDGQFLRMTWDMAIMYPIAEMSAERHAFISDVNYVYNMETPINDNKVDAELQNFLDKLIRGRPRYKRLEEAEIELGK